MNQLEHRIIGNVKQYFGIYSKNINNPILLYLHGGPGDSCLPLIEKYNLSLVESFTLVVLEQRGAGLSYYKFSKSENLSISTFVDDIYEFSKYLLGRFKRKKLYILGHSWGSVLGIKFIEKYPHLVQAYLGCGQVVNMEENLNSQIKFIEKYSSNLKVQKRLNNIKQELNGDDWVNSLLYLTRQIVKLKGSIYGKTSMNSLIIPFLFSKHYSILNLLNRQRGSIQSIEYFWKELMEINFDNLNNFKVPIILFEGQYDFHVSSEIAGNWYKNITTKKHYHSFEKSGHFPQWEESEKFNSIVLDLKINIKNKI